MSLLTLLANRYHTDKGTSEAEAHGYTEFYSFLFEQFRYDRFSMLEIGLGRLGIEGTVPTKMALSIPSVRMWLDFFPNAFCYGFDVLDFSQVSLDRFGFIRGDLSDPVALDMLFTKLPPLKLIVDDASHASLHQQFALTKLFDRVEPGGFYVIEDLHGAPELETVRKTSTVLEEFLETHVLKFDFASKESIERITKEIGNTFVHRTKAAGSNRWYPKMVVFQKR